MHKIYLLTLLSTIVTAQGMESNNPEPKSAITKLGKNPNIMGVIMNYMPLDEAKKALDFSKQYKKKKESIIDGRLLDTDINLTQFVDNLLYMKENPESLQMFIKNLKDMGPKEYNFYKKHNNKKDRDEELWGNLGKVYRPMDRKTAQARLAHNEQIMKITDPDYRVENREAEIQKMMKEGHFITMAPFRIPKELSYIRIEVTDDPEDDISAENPFKQKTTYILGSNTLLEKYKDEVNSFKAKGFNMKSKSTQYRAGSRAGSMMESTSVKKSVKEVKGSPMHTKTFVDVDFYGCNINEDGTPINTNLDEYGQPKVQQQDVNKPEESKDNQ